MTDTELRDRDAELEDQARRALLDLMRFRHEHTTERSVYEYASLVGKSPHQVAGTRSAFRVLLDGRPYFNRLIAIEPTQVPS